MLSIEVVEIALGDARSQALHDIFQASLRDGDDLVAATADLQGRGNELDRRSPVDGDNVDQRLERHTLRGPEAPFVPRPLLEVRPRQLDV